MEHRHEVIPRTKLLVTSENFVCHKIVKKTKENVLLVLVFRNIEEQLRYAIDWRIMPLPIEKI